MTAEEFKTCKNNLERIEAIAVKAYGQQNKESLRLAFDAVVKLYELQQTIKKPKGQA